MVSINTIYRNYSQKHCLVTKKMNNNDICCMSNGEELSSRQCACNIKSNSKITCCVEVTGFSFNLISLFFCKKTEIKDDQIIEATFNFSEKQSCSESRTLKIKSVGSQLPNYLYR